MKTLLRANPPLRDGDVPVSIVGADRQDLVAMLQEALPGLAAGEYQRIINALLIGRPIVLASLERDDASTLCLHLMAHGFRVACPEVVVGQRWRA